MCTSARKCLPFSLGNLEKLTGLEHREKYKINKE
uniref:Uncharacterized protein n=1 Tax=Anguilla anguilla TaxID=7936 RepID=A0A0E9VPF7_ANGAN